jgi:hypothetical protein
MKLNKYLTTYYAPLVPAIIKAGGDQGRGSYMKNPSLVNAKYCGRALSISSVICLLLFTGCSSIDGTAAKVTANLVTSHVEPGQEEPANQPVSPEPSYEWFY